MQFREQPGLIDSVSGQAYSIPFGAPPLYERDSLVRRLKQTSAYTYRITLKPGITELNLSGVEQLLYAYNDGTDDQLHTFPNRDAPSTISVGQKPTLILASTPDTAAPTIDFSTFFSQIETAHDAFPLLTAGYTAPIAIDSENFTAPQGVFDITVKLEIQNQDRININFHGSTFKIAPRIYSTLETLETFPIDGGGWEPFRDCPNVEKIEYQGTFDKIRELYTVNFTYQDEQGNDVFNAYPEGGAPTRIENYITYTGAPVRMSSKFPVFSSENLQVITGHLTAQNFIFDAPPQLPFGGIDFSNASKLATLQLPTLSFDEAENHTGMNANIMFTWSSLGVTIPRQGRMKTIGGLYDIYQVLSQPDNDTDVDYEYSMNVIAPGQDGGMYQGWVNNLEQLDLDTDVNFVPPVQTGTEFIVGYYRKHVVGSSAPDDTTGFYDHEIIMPSNWQLQIPSLPGGITTLYAFAENTYAHELIDYNVTVPAPPASVTHLRDCYRRLFYNSIGERGQTITAEESEPKVVVAYALQTPGRTSGNAEMTVVFNPAKTHSVDSEFSYLWNERYEMDLNEIQNEFGVPPYRTSDAYDYSYRGAFSAERSIPGTGFGADAGYFAEANANNKLFGDEGTPFFQETGRLMPSYEEMMNTLYRPETLQAELRKINSNITFETGSYSSLEISGSFHQEAFYGAYVHPEEINMYPPFPQRDEWNSYRDSGAYRLLKERDTYQEWSIGGSFIVPSYDNNDDLAEYSVVRFVAFSLLDQFTEDELSSLSVHYDNMLFNGSQRTEGDTVIRPYEHAFSRSIEGSVDDFKAVNDILANNTLSSATGVNVYGFQGSPAVISSRRVLQEESGYFEGRNFLVPAGSRNSLPGNNVKIFDAPPGLHIMAAPSPNLMQRNTNYNEIHPEWIYNYDITPEIVNIWNNFLQFSEPLVVYSGSFDYIEEDTPYRIRTATQMRNLRQQIDPSLRL